MSECASSQILFIFPSASHIRVTFIPHSTYVGMFHIEVSNWVLKASRPKLGFVRALKAWDRMSCFTRTHAGVLFLREQLNSLKGSAVHFDLRCTVCSNRLRDFISSVDLSLSSPCQTSPHFPPVPRPFTSLLKQSHLTSCLSPLWYFLLAVLDST